MSQHFFGLGNGRIERDVVDAIDRIAAPHDASITTFDDPARGPRYWMSCPNRGAPFDGATARAVLDELDAAGLWPPTSPDAIDAARELADHPF